MFFAVYSSAVHCSRMQWCTVQFSALHYSSFHCSAVQCHTVQYSAVRCSGPHSFRSNIGLVMYYPNNTLCSMVLWTSVHCSVLHYSPVQWSVMQWSTVLDKYEVHFSSVYPVHYHGVVNTVYYGAEVYVNIIYVMAVENTPVPCHVRGNYCRVPTGRRDL